MSETIPKVLTDQGGVWNNFASFLNEQITFYGSEISSLRDLYTAERTRTPFEIAYFKGAYIAINDTINDLRNKAAGAVNTHKNLVVFEDVYKPIIDRILGSDCSLTSYSFMPQIFTINKSIIASPAYIEWIPDMPTPSKLKGQIFIDIGMVAMDSQIQSIRRQLSELSVMYFKIYLGRVFTITATPFVIADSLIGGTDIINFEIPAGNYFTPQFAIN